MKISPRIHHANNKQTVSIFPPSPPAFAPHRLVFPHRGWRPGSPWAPGLSDSVETEQWSPAGAPQGKRDGLQITSSTPEGTSDPHVGPHTPPKSKLSPLLRQMLSKMMPFVSSSGTGTQGGEFQSESLEFLAVDVSILGAKKWF